MPSPLIPNEPNKCFDMTEVRAGVDAIDTALIGLLARRFSYMDAAARIKPSRSDVRDEGRKAQVIGNVKAAAATKGVPVHLVAALWDLIVEASITHELEQWDAANSA